MKELEFSKLSGQGNDFILIDSTKQQQHLSASQIKSACDRHFGIGADGVIIVRKSDAADFFMDYYNSDGTIAEMCGNGIRCMARFLFEKKLISKDKIIIETRAGLKKIKLQLSENKKIGLIEVSMGTPVFEPEKIPVDTEAAKKIMLPSEGSPEEKNNPSSGTENLFFMKKFAVNDKIYSFNCLSMGNPHCVIFISDDENLEDIDLKVIGPEIENHPIFPQKTNVEFVKILKDNEISMRVWERGCGETLACGTGACASAAAAILLHKIKPGEVTVIIKGGKLQISWTGDSEDSIFLKGRVEYIFDGKYFYDNQM